MTADPKSPSEEDRSPAAGKEPAESPPPAASAPPKAPAVKLVDRDLTDQQLEEMIDQGVFTPDIVEVELYGNKLTGRSLKLLASSPLKSLQKLDIYNNEIGDEGARVIAREPLYRGLNHLSVAYNGLTIDGVRALLGKSSKLTGVSTLLLDGTPMGDEGVEVVVRSSQAEHLRFLSVTDTGMTDTGAKLLAESESLAKLDVLNVSKNSLSESAVAALRKSPHLKGCRVLAD